MVEPTEPTASGLISRLRRVPLREVWKHEAYDFTTWLQENIDVLSDALGRHLENVERERSAGSFNIDLVAEDLAGNKVIVENQLGRSDHDHLGKLLTYLTAMNARSAIWIVAEPRPEHVAVIAWLNDNSSADFHLVKVEAVRIGTSPPAPLLTKIVGPSEETAEVAKSNKEFSERYDRRMKWWSELVKRPDAKHHNHIRPGIYSWIGVSMGVRGLNLNLSVRKQDCQAEIYIDRGKGCGDENLSIFDQLAARRDEIERLFGAELEWQRLETSRACRIAAVVEGGYQLPDEDWDDVQTELLRQCDKLSAAVQPFVKTLRLSA
jgi:hypothetical protein